MAQVPFLAICTTREACNLDLGYTLDPSVWLFNMACSIVGEEVRMLWVLLRFPSRVPVNANCPCTPLANHPNQDAYRMLPSEKCHEGQVGEQKQGIDNLEQYYDYG